MAKRIYNGVGNVARKVATPYVGVDNVSREVKCGYIGIDNIARQCFGTRISELSVGDSVYMNFSYGSGIPIPTEFLIIHKGNPDSAVYDSSCDGIWLLIKDCYTISNYSGAENSNAFDGVNNAFLNNQILKGCFDEGVQSIIKQVKIPYYVGGGNNTLKTLEDGFPVKLFYLSYPEVRKSSYSPYYDGSILDYFRENSIVAYYNNEAVGWWLRTPRKDHATYETYVNQYGSMVDGAYSGYEQLGNRFALILPYETFIDSHFNVIG
jgi:hypothetical protein